MSEADNRKPCESRGARTVLRARRGEIPSSDSPVQSVDELDIAVTAKAEDTGYLLADQIVDDDLSSVELVGRHCGLLENAAQYGGRWAQAAQAICRDAMRQARRPDHAARKARFKAGEDYSP